MFCSSSSSAPIIIPHWLCYFVDLSGQSNGWHSEAVSTAPTTTGCVLGVCCLSASVLGSRATMTSSSSIAITIIAAPIYGLNHPLLLLFFLCYCCWWFNRSIQSWLAVPFYMHHNPPHPWRSSSPPRTEDKSQCVSNHQSSVSHVDEIYFSSPSHSLLVASVRET